MLLRPFDGPRGELRRVAALEMLVGHGGAASPQAWEAVGAACAEAGRAAVGLVPRIALDARGLAAADAGALGVGAALRAWRFTALQAGKRRLRLELVASPGLEASWGRAEAVLEGVAWAREAVAEPANRLTPTELTRRLLALRASGLEVEAIEGEALAALGAGGLLAVGGGSAQGPRLVVLRWAGGGREDARVAFVGKGICFDTGGLSIKGAAGMEAMRADMAGAATCAGAMLALARRRSPCPAVAVLAIAENVTGARSYRPGDVLRMASGRSVEVVDTDAEGRLVLADALHVALRRFAPGAVLDLATLTGSVVVALGHQRAGLFCEDAALAAAVRAAGDAVGEPVWPLPIGGRHREDLRSDIADLRQCAPAGSGAWGGRLLPDASHAAAFLREFVGETPWAHLDIAGMETAEDDDGLAAKGQPTGFGVRLLDALVERHFEAS
jgi:leucyl aminopeptidase